MGLADFLKPPKPTDDKYSRGVVGFVTGSEMYPGAAVLGITAAMRTGVGMVRYLGPERVSNLLVQTRPETVLQDGRAQAWVVGSGVPAEDAEQASRIGALADTETLLVVDAGALEMVDFDHCKATCVLTPHTGEAATLLTSLGHSITRAEVESDPIKFALLIASLTNQLTVLKGNRTVIAQDTKTYQFDSAPSVLATAGSGDVLAGIIGALLASNSESIRAGKAELFEVVKAAITLQAQAAELASKNSTVVALDIAEAVGQAVTAAV